MSALESLVEPDELRFLHEAANAVFQNMDEQEATCFGV